MEFLIHKLDKDNFYYQSIMTLAFAQFGINEMFARGFVLKHQATFPNLADYISYIDNLGFPSEVKAQILNTQTFTPMIFVPGFTTKDKTSVYRMDPNSSALKFVEEERGITGKNIELTHMTIISAWEMFMALKPIDSPILQFFRHIRNAAAHNGKFHFDKKVIDASSGELKLEASWKGFVITAKHQGVHLIPKDKNDNDSFLDQGDLVEFLLDLENHYPELKNHCT